MRCFFAMLLFFFTNTLSSQVYGYLPVSLSNIETNPCFVASENNKFFTGISHINNFSDAESFSYTSFKISRFFKYNFFGVGLIASHTSIYDTINYQHIGLSAAYRNILFNTIYLKLGVTYKFLNINAPNGNFIKYHFVFKDSSIINRTDQNFNFSVSLSSPKEKYYLICGLLNSSPFEISKEANKELFPKYMYVTLGNFLNLINSREISDLSFTVIGEKFDSEEAYLQYYLSFFTLLNIDHHKTLRFGGDIGYKTNHFISFRPALYLYIPKVIGKRNKDRRRYYNEANVISVKLSADFAIQIKPGEKTYKPAYQLYLMYNI